MNNNHFAKSLVFSLLSIVCLTGADWPQFRGPNSASVVESSELPESLEGDALAWSVDLEGRGISSPILVGEQVILTSCDGPGQQRLSVVSFSRETGKRNWKRTFWATGRTTTYPTSSVATPSPATDGKHIVAFYSSNDVVCLDLEGNLLWYRGLGFDFPNASNSLGMASSTIIVDGAAICMVENEVDSFTICLELKDGTTRWRKSRPRKANWTSPIIFRDAEGENPLVLLQAFAGIAAVNLKDGETVWEYNMESSTIPSAVSAPGMVYVPSSGLTAFKPSTKKPGETEIVWQKQDLGPSTMSPVLSDGKIYIITGAGVLRCGNAKTGETLWNLRLKGRFSATPIIAGNRLYAVNQKAVVYAVELGEKKAKILSTRELSGMIQASPAGADGELFIRSDKKLWKFAASNK